MKKLAIIILVLALAAGGLFFGYRQLNAIRVAEIESIVPDDIIYYLYSYNLDGKIKEFKAGGFFKEIVASSLYPSFIDPALKRLKQKIPFLPDLIQKDAALVVYSLPTRGASGVSPSENLGDFLFLVRIDPKKNIGVKKSIADFYLSFTSKDQVSRDAYKGIALTNYRLPNVNMSMHYAMISDVILISNSIGLIHKAIDLAKKQSTASLQNNKSFQKFNNRIKKDSIFWGYMNSRNYNQQSLYNTLGVRETGSRQSLAYLASLKPVLNLFNTLEDNVFYMDYDPARNGLVFSGFQTFNKSLKDEANIFRLFYSFQPMNRNVFNLIPRNAVFYFGGTQDLNNLWEGLSDIYSPLVATIKAGLQSRSGVNIETELLPLLGTNYGIVLFDIAEIETPVLNPGLPEQPQNFSRPLPRFYAFIELKDKPKMQAFMDKMAKNIVDKVNKEAQQRQKALMDNYGEQKKSEETARPQPAAETEEYLKLESENYKGVDITLFKTPDSPAYSFDLNYCIVDKYFILSFSPSLSRKIIDAYNDKASSLSSDFEFESAENKMLSGYSSLLFFDFRRLMENLKNTKSFGALQSSLPVQAGSGFSRENLDALFKILNRVCSFSLTYKVVDDYTVESSGYIKIEGL